MCKNCSECQNKKTICVHIMFSPCSELVVFMDWTGKSTNNFLSFCGLFDAKIRASDKNLPVLRGDTRAYFFRIYIKFEFKNPLILTPLDSVNVVSQDEWLVSVYYYIATLNRIRPHFTPWNQNTYKLPGFVRFGQSDWSNSLTWLIVCNRFSYLMNF